METHTPKQYSTVGHLIKTLLHTRIGAYLGYASGITGFNRIDAYVTRAGGQVEFLGASYNARVNAGAALVASLISGTTLGGITSPSAAKYIAVSTSGLTPAAGDTSLSGETSSSGMGRALASAGTYITPSTLDGAASYVLSKTYTATAGITIVSAAIFDAVTGGNMLAEANLASSAILANGDTLSIGWTINL